MGKENTGNGFAYEFISSDTEYECPWYRVDDVHYKVDGKPMSRLLIGHPDVVNVMVHDADNDRYLIEREFRLGAGRVKVNVPSGFIFDGENPSMAVVRETREETGLRIDASDLIRLFEVYKSEGGQTEKAYCFRIDVHDVAANIGDTDMDEGEVITSEWVDFDTMYGLFLSGDISDASSTALVLAERIIRDNGTL